MVKEYISVAEARTILAVSKTKMSALIANGIISTYPNDLDARSKLVKIEDIEALKVNGTIPRKRTVKAQKNGHSLQTATV